jgi:hypothetical protein
MSDEFSKLNLQDDFAEAADAPEAQRWKLKVSGDLEVCVILSPESACEEQFQARLSWNKYPDEPPSLKFRDPATGSITSPQAWPLARGFRPQSLDACVNWCAEGFALHPEWKNDPRLKWNASGNPLLWVIRQLQEELDHYYQGRFR